MDECLRINKPCKFENIAKSWPGFEKWRFNALKEDNSDLGKPYEYLEERIGGNKMVDVYIDLDPEANFDSAPSSSFKKSMLSKMKYSEFLDKSGH